MCIQMCTQICVYKPPNKCEETSDLKNGKCSECQLFNGHGEKYTHNNEALLKNPYSNFKKYIYRVSI